jgi:hypothetical protein
MESSEPIDEQNSIIDFLLMPLLMLLRLLWFCAEGTKRTKGVCSCVMV